MLPMNVDSPRHAGYRIWAEHYGFLRHVDHDSVAIRLNTGLLHDNDRLPCSVKAVIFTSFGEHARYPVLIDLARRHPDTRFFWLTDYDLYDWPIPDNIVHIEYRHWHLYAKWWKQHAAQTPTRASLKKIQYKFSSLSWKPRQHRALISAALLTYAPDQSIVSWHARMEHMNEFEQQHADLIQQVRRHPAFQDLVWSNLDRDHVMDDYNDHLPPNADSSVQVERNILNIDNVAFENSLINFSNETDCFGYCWDASGGHVRPGPGLTEKTFKCLLAGCVLIPVGQPNCYDLLRRFNLCPDYSFDQTFDSITGDFDRYRATVDLVKQLAKTSLSDLVDANIAECERLQHTLLDQQNLDSMDRFNQQQDGVLLEHLQKL